MKKLISSLLFIVAVCNAYSQSGIKRILLEEFSTAPCGFCPDGDVIAKQLVDSHPEVIWVTHHAGFGTDAMTVPESGTIAGAFTTFAPGACIDRGDYPIPVYTSPPYIAVSRQKWDSLVVAHLNDPPVADIILSNTYNPVTRIINCYVDVNFITTPTPGDLRINLFFVEDSVTGTGTGYDQTNYFNTTFGHPCYNLGDPIVGYQHDRVIRKIETGAWGLSGIIPANPVAGSSYTHHFNNISIPATWKDLDMSMVGFVSYYNANTHLRQVINSNEQAFIFGFTGFEAIDNFNDDFVIYPNPSGDIINLHINNQVILYQAAAFCIFDLTGRLLMKKQISGSATPQDYFMDISTIATGSYLLKIESAGKVYRKMFLVE